MIKSIISVLLMPVASFVNLVAALIMGFSFVFMKNHASLWQMWIGQDQLLNTALGGDADETISARAFRQGKTSKKWAIIRLLLDAVFYAWEPDHCEKSYQNERY